MRFCHYALCTNGDEGVLAGRRDENGGFTSVVSFSTNRPGHRLGLNTFIFQESRSSRDRYLGPKRTAGSRINLDDLLRRTYPVVDWTTSTRREVRRNVIRASGACGRPSGTRDHPLPLRFRCRPRNCTRRSATSRLLCAVPETGAILRRRRRNGASRCPIRCSASPVSTC